MAATKAFILTLHIVLSDGSSSPKTPLPPFVEPLACTLSGLAEAQRELEQKGPNPAVSVLWNCDEEDTKPERKL
jgi:hypothetical protein